MSLFTPFRRRPKAAQDWPGILMVVGSHGFPATQARLTRATELAREFCLRQERPDVVVLLERPFEPSQESGLLELRRYSDRFDVVLHPWHQSSLCNAIGRIRRRLGGRDRLGGETHCPKRFLRFLRRRYGSRPYRAVLAFGVHLVPALQVFPQCPDRLVDLPRMGSDNYWDHARQGRGDAFAAFGVPGEELRLLDLVDGAMVTCPSDAACLRQLGFQRELLLFPPTALVEGHAPPWASDQWAASGEKEPPRPPRILCVGSETTANLDGLRWFRRQVFPRIVRSVPTCRLRLLGEAARFIEPGPGVDRLGWSQHLHEEYRDSTVVALPLRMGAGIRRRTVEALAWGKALATTTRGAEGSCIHPGRHAIVSDEAEELAAGIVAVLTDSALRRRLESNAERFAKLYFDSSQMSKRLARRLGLGPRVSELVTRRAEPHSVSKPAILDAQPG